jgi:predicted metal-binding protein
MGVAAAGDLGEFGGSERLMAFFSCGGCFCLREHSVLAYKDE